jgi:hypothetical protein
MGRAEGEKAAAVPKSAAMRMAVRDIICHKNAYIRLGRYRTKKDEK